MTKTTIEIPVVNSKRKRLKVTLDHETERVLVEPPAFMVRTPQVAFDELWLAVRQLEEARMGTAPPDPGVPAP